MRWNAGKSHLLKSLESIACMHTTYADKIETQRKIVIEFRTKKKWKKKNIKAVVLCLSAHFNVLLYEIAKA